MARNHLTVVLSALVLPVLLAGCSGGEDTPTPAGPTSGASTSSAAPTDSAGADGEPGARPSQVGALVKKCRVDVKITGEVTGGWTGPGEVRLRNASDTGDGPRATYVSEDGSFQLMVYSGGPGFKEAATLAVNGTGYTTFPGVATSVGLDAGASGKGADVDVDLTGPDGVGMSRLQATFTCKKR